MSILLIGGALVLSGCGSKSAGSDKYKEADSLLKEMAKAMETFTGSLDKVTTAADAVKAINDFTAGMKTLKPKLKALEGKYPELKDEKEPPAELKGTMKLIEEAGKKMAGSFMKLAQFQNDAGVKKAMEEFQKVMQ